MISFLMIPEDPSAAAALSVVLSIRKSNTAMVCVNLYIYCNISNLEKDQIKRFTVAAVVNSNYWLCYIRNVCPL